VIFDNFNQLNKTIPSEGRLMAIDVGTKRIGIAVCDKSRMIATPKTTIKRKSNANDFIKIKALIEENDIKAIIIGLPINMDESENEMTKFSRRFTQNLDEFLDNVKICFHDERLTSFMAKDDLINMIKGKKDKKNSVIDQMAASLILQSVLDQQ
jgi:putative Holliday junction resolvase